MAQENKVSHHVQHSLLCHCLLWYLCRNICLLRSFQGLSGKLTRDTQDCEHTRDVLLGVASVPMLPLVATHKGHSQSHTQSLLLVTSDSNVVMLTGIARAPPSLISGWLEVSSGWLCTPEGTTIPHLCPPALVCKLEWQLSSSFPQGTSHCLDLVVITALLALFTQVPGQTNTTQVYTR